MVIEDDEPDSIDAEDEDEAASGDAEASSIERDASPCNTLSTQEQSPS